MNIEPRNGFELSPTAVFDKQCAETRLKELTLLFITKFATEDMEKIADEARRAFKPIPIYEHGGDSEFLYAKFGEQARKEAEKILEAERKALTEYRAESIKKTLNIIIRQLRFLIYSEHGKGKIYIKKVPIEGKTGQNAPSEREVEYFESYPEGVEHLERIGRVLSCFRELNDYAPYFSIELHDLWRQAQDLASLERVREKKDAKT